MKVDITNVIYTVSMIVLAFISAIVVTKTLSKYIEKKKDKEEL
ncbi:hypothetical protein [Sulfurovum lithotrophicum]|nr:hypothetical protein [Sulfurovum lithotrophicum]